MDEVIMKKNSLVNCILFIAGLLPALPGHTGAKPTGPGMEGILVSVRKLSVFLKKRSPLLSFPISVPGMLLKKPTKSRMY
jgi:hypothetical protein